MRTSSIGTPSYRSFSVACSITPASTARPRPSHDSCTSAVSFAISSGRDLPFFGDIDQRLRRGLRLRFALFGAFLRALLAIQHVSARRFVLAGAHQREFDLILDVLDVERAAIGLTPHECADHGLGQFDNEFAHARRRRTLATVNGNEGLGHRDRNLGRLEADHCAIAANPFSIALCR